MSYLVGFVRFWYDFIVGDDWQIAVGVAIAMTVTAVLAGIGVPAWWVVPAAAAGMLTLSLWRVSQRRG